MNPSSVPLAGKVAIVTGAAQGIGRATAEKLADNGASLGLVDLQAEAIDELAAELHGKSQKAVAVSTDVSSGTAVRQMVERVAAAFGTVHILVNNAGVLRNSPVMEMPESEWDLVVDVCLKGAFLCSQGSASDHGGQPLRKDRQHLFAGSPQHLRSRRRGLHVGQGRVAGL